MSIQMVLLPIFIQIGLTFVLLFGMATARGRGLSIGRARMGNIALREPVRDSQLGNCFADQFELPVLFYILIALALPLRHADLFIVLMSWVFVVTRFAHAGVFVTSNDVRPRSLAWFAGVLVLAAMWLYFALKMLLLI
ncbi:MAPEG family protein [Bradyrhizobium genosp. P]|uniref:MAPEG family protein n=1 Tax=Bradyrhizobium genosp. P TaxID=83641 RepID=UPI003CEC5EFD